MKLKNYFISALLLGCSLTSYADGTYTIYPIPQEQVAVEGTTLFCAGKIQIVCGADIDVYTKDRIRNILEERALVGTDEPNLFVEAPQAGYTHIYVGVNGKNDAADQKATELGLSRDVFANTNKYDKHILSINDNAGYAQVVILGENTDAAFIGMASLEQILDAYADKTYTLPCGIIYDYADQKNRGLVEGYYGVPYSIDVKKDLMRYMMRYKMNSYMYGAKNEKYHSTYWKDPYPTTITEEQRKGGYLTQDMVKEITAVSHATKVNFIWAIHPGNQFLNSSTVVTDIMNKFEHMYGLGVRQFGVFVDDVGIPNTQEGYDLNAQRVTEVQRAIEAKWNVEGAAPADTVKPLQFVPQIYCTSFAGSTDQHNKFFEALASTPKNVDIYTTGWGIWSVPNSGDVNHTRQYLGRDVAWWWNYPCNDNDHTKLFPMDMYNNFKDESHINSSATVDAGLSNCIGVLSNPMQEGEVSKIPLFGVADYAWNNNTFNNLKNWEAALISVVGADKAEALKTVCQHIRYYDAGLLSSLITTYKNSLKKGTPDGEALRVELQKLIDACATIQTLKDSEDESERLFHTDIEPWLNKLEAMARQAHGLTLVAEIPNEEEADKWTTYAPLTTGVDLLDTDAPYNFPQLDNGSRNSEPGHKELRPFVTYLQQNVLGDMLPVQMEAKLFTNVADATGRIRESADRIQPTSCRNTLKKGEYIGIELAQPILLSDIVIADTLATNYTVQYSPNGKTWKRYTKATHDEALARHIKYICVHNESETPRYVNLSATKTFVLYLPQMPTISEVAIPEGDIWQNHDATYITDGDYTTFTCLNQNQRANDAYTLTLKEVTPISDVRICMGTVNGDYMTSGRVQISTDGTTWKSLPMKGSSDIDFRMSKVTVKKYSDEMSYCDFDGKEQEAKYVRLFLQTPNASKWLRLYEMEVNLQTYNAAFRPLCADGDGVGQETLTDGVGYTHADDAQKSLTYYIYKYGKVSNVKILQDATRPVASAKVQAATNEAATEWTDLCELTDNYQVVNLENYPDCAAIRIAWTGDKAPYIYEIIPVMTDTDKPLVSSIENIGATVDAPVLKLLGGNAIQVSSEKGIRAIRLFAADGKCLLTHRPGGEKQVVLPLTPCGKGSHVVSITLNDGTTSAYKVMMK